MDDMIDNASLRHGVPCWYRKPDVGLAAGNDAAFIISSYYELIKLYFKEKPFYIDLWELMNDVSNF